MSDVTRLASQLAEALDRIKALEEGGVGLGRSSFERGGITQFVPGTDTPAAKFGQQFDGTTGAAAFTGPVPPRQSAPTVQGGVERLTVRWDGLWYRAVDETGRPTFAPLDWSSTEVHVVQVEIGAPAPAPGITFETLRGNIASPRGGETSILGLAPDKDCYVWLVARATTGKWSEPSPVVGPVRVTRLTVEDLDLESIGGNTVFYGDETPTANKIGDLWLRETGVVTTPPDGDPTSDDGLLYPSSTLYPSPTLYPTGENA